MCWEGGVEKDVAFVAAGYEGDDRIEAAHATEYRRYGERSISPMTSPRARAATLELVPRNTGDSF